MNSQHLRLCAAFLVIASSITFAHARLDAQLELTGTTMGTMSWTVKIANLPAGTTEAQVEALIAAQLEDVNQRMSTYRADSEVSRFNTSNSTDWFEVSAATATVVAAAQEISRQTDGSFDITVSPLVNLWHFGPNPEAGTLIPEDEAIAAQLAHVGFRKLHVRELPPALKKDDPALQIDLSAIAKGYAVDLVATALIDNEITNFLAEVGGEVRASGEKAQGQAWRIGVVRPDGSPTSVERVVELNNISMATSGDYRNFFVVDGRRYSHTIDPQTGRPVTNSIAAATVLAPDCMTADAIATAVMVMGVQRGHELCERLGLPLFTIERTSTGFGERASANFPTEPAESLPSSFWPTLVITAVVFGLAIVAMAAGVIFGNRRISGSCGGLAGTTDGEGNIACSLCRNPAAECREQAAADASAKNHRDHD